MWSPGIEDLPKTRVTIPIIIWEKGRSSPVKTAFIIWCCIFCDAKAIFVIKEAPPCKKKRIVDRSYTLAVHTVIGILHAMSFTLLTSLLVTPAKGTFQTAEDSKKCKCCSKLHFRIVFVVHCASFPRTSVFIAMELLAKCNLHSRCHCQISTWLNCRLLPLYRSSMHTLMDYHQTISALVLSEGFTTHSYTQLGN